jgi:hypothetical protein
MLSRRTGWQSVDDWLPMCLPLWQLDATTGGDDWQSDDEACAIRKSSVSLVLRFEQPNKQATTPILDVHRTRTFGVPKEEALIWYNNYTYLDKLTFR